MTDFWRVLRTGLVGMLGHGHIEDDTHMRRELERWYSTVCIVRCTSYAEDYNSFNSLTSKKVNDLGYILSSLFPAYFQLYLGSGTTDIVR